MRQKRILPVLATLALLAVLATCRMDTAFGPASSTATLLPADKVLDVARSYGGSFEYATLLPVELNLTAELYRQPAPSAALERLAADVQLILVSLENSRGERLYSGSIPSGGTLHTVLSLPAAPEELVLRLESPGFEPREVTIDGMVLYSQVSRVMGLLSRGLSAKGEVLADADLDGVPDLYDLDPLDPLVAFTVRSPASGYFTVAFEDLYPVPGDADYNDFVAGYFVQEQHMAEPLEQMAGEPGKPQPVEVMLHALHGEATATAKVAGYNHKFGLVVDFPGVTAASVTREYVDAFSIRRKETQTNVADRAVIWLFENTRYAVGQTASFDITFPKGVTRSMLSVSPHDPVLQVLNTGKDIHLIGRNPLSGPVAGRAFMDPHGYPWALLVPADWRHPAETQYIGKAYPLFDEWRASEGAKAPYWYLYPASASSLPGNNPPYPVTAPTAAPQLVAGSAAAQGFDLSFQSADGSGDPDGDAVQFLHSPVPMVLRELFSLDAATGRITFKPGVPQGDYPFYFWSQDEHGASTLATPFAATFRFQGKAANNPPVVSFPAWNYLVEGAGTAAANGGYALQSALTNGYPWYLQESGQYALFNFTALDDARRHWGLNTGALPGYIWLSQVGYYSATSLAPPEAGWATAVGAGTPPSVLRFPISGSTAVGGTLTAQYVFTDPDGDAEGDSRFQWYRFETSAATTGGTLVGTDSRSYTSAAGDQYKWLRVEVTPVDNSGEAGSPVLSSKAVQVGGGS